jgi:hypothetical protein
VAILTLFALCSRSLSRRWFAVNIGFTAFMVIGSLVTGYHYLIDGYAGILIGWGVYRLGGSWVRKWPVGGSVARAAEDAGRGGSPQAGAAGS